MNTWPYFYRLTARVPHDQPGRIPGLPHPYTARMIDVARADLYRQAVTHIVKQSLALPLESQGRPWSALRLHQWEVERQEPFRIVTELHVDIEMVQLESSSYPPRFAPDVDSMTTPRLIRSAAEELRDRARRALRRLVTRNRSR